MAADFLRCHETQSFSLAGAEEVEPLAVAATSQICIISPWGQVRRSFVEKRAEITKSASVMQVS